MTIYLAGSLQGPLRERVIRALIDKRHTLIDPATSGLINEIDYTRWDLRGIDRCETVVAFMDSNNPSGYGLNFEIGYAYATKKRIVFLDMLGTDWRVKYFGMVRAVVSQTVYTVEELAEVV